MLTIRHSDTCLPCYVQDHCNGDCEALLGVPVSRADRNHHVRAAVLSELRNLEKLPDYVTPAMIESAVADMFEDAHPLRTFDSSLESASAYDDAAESCYAWIRVTWTGEAPPAVPMAELTLWDSAGGRSDGEAFPVPMREVDAPRSGRTQSGYGAAIPSDLQVRYRGRWRRVYIAIYGNSGSAYIGKPGAWIATVDR